MFFNAIAAYQRVEPFTLRIEFVADVALQDEGRISVVIGVEVCRHRARKLARGLTSRGPQRLQCWPNSGRKVGTPLLRSRKLILVRADGIEAPTFALYGRDTRRARQRLT
jgi:hypothetical protein